MNTEKQLRSQLIALIILVVIAAAGGVALLVTRGNSSGKKAADTSSQQVKTGNDATIAIDACDVLTAGVARSILGEGAIKGDTSAGRASNDAVSVSMCTYYRKIDPLAGDVNNTNGVSILVRAARNETGAKSNKAQFTTGKPKNVTDVSGLGDKAYYNRELKQLNVLKGSNLYIVSSYEGDVTTGASLSLDKQLAEKLHFR